MKNKSRIMLYKGRRKNALSVTGSAFSVIWQVMPAGMHERKGVYTMAEDQNNKENTTASETDHTNEYEDVCYICRRYISRMISVSVRTVCRRPLTR